VLAVTDCVPNVTEISVPRVEHTQKNFRELPLASNSGES
jgi:hypothetical protein